jgi:hypothetical protein
VFGSFEEGDGGFGGWLLVDEVEEVLFVDFHEDYWYGSE